MHGRGGNGNCADAGGHVTVRLCGSMHGHEAKGKQPGSQLRHIPSMPVLAAVRVSKLEPQPELELGPHFAARPWSAAVRLQELATEVCIIPNTLWAVINACAEQANAVCGLWTYCSNDRYLKVA